MDKMARDARKVVSVINSCNSRMQLSSASNLFNAWDNAYWLKSKNRKTRDESYALHDKIDLVYWNKLEEMQDNDAPKDIAWVKPKKESLDEYLERIK